MFQMELYRQLKIWIALGLVILPISAFIFGPILKYLVRIYNKISLSVSKAIVIQLVVSFYCWLFLIIPIFGSQLIKNSVFWQTINGITSIIIGAICYSKMIKEPGLGQIGMKKGLEVSALMAAIAIVILIPIKLIRA